MAGRTIPANTVRVEVDGFAKLTSTERTAATNWLTAIVAQVVANGANLKNKTTFVYPSK